MFFWKKTAKTAKRPRKAGNSLTFLLSSVAVFSLSLSVTTVALGPMVNKGSNSLVQVSGVTDLAENHLDQIEALMKANPDVFLNDSNWDAVFSLDNDNLPPYQVFNASATTAANFDSYFTTASLKTETATIKLNGATVTATSTMSQSSPVQSVLRFSSAAYQNTFRISVEAQAATTTVIRSRTITLSRNVCDVNKGPTVSDITLPYDASETSDFSIKKVSGPFIQLGPRICMMPDKVPGTALSCDAVVAGGANLLAGMEDTVAGYKSTTHFDYLPATQELKLTYKQGPTPAVVQSVVLPTPAGPNPLIAVDIIRPAASDASNTYKAAIFFVDSTGVLKLTWARWTASSAVAEGVFASGAPVYNADPFGATVADAFTYNASTHMLVIANNATKQIFAKRLQTVSATPSTPPAVDGTWSATSEVPLATSPGVDLTSGTFTAFGKPLVSKDGQFIVVPASYSDPKVLVFAFNTNTGDSGRIETHNNSLNLPVDPTLKSNIATLISFNGVDGPAVSSLTDLYLAYNNSTEKFYMLAKNTGNNFLEWDPKTWGIAPVTAASDWVKTTMSRMQKLRNVSIIGSDPSDGGTSYIGTYFTVRQIGPQPSVTSTALWTGLNTPQLVYNKFYNEFYLRDGDIVHAINLVKGYKTDITSGLTGPADGPSMALDYRTGSLYLGASNIGTLYRGLHAYDPSTGTFPQITPGGSTMDFSDGPAAGNKGDGDIIFFVNNMSPYFMDLPNPVSTSSRPIFRMYQPFCSSSGSFAGDLNGFTPMATNWRNYDDDDDYNL